MKKFKFSLQNLLDLRIKQLEEKQIEFGKLQFAMRTLQNELSNLQEEYSCSKSTLLNRLTINEKMDIALISANQRHIAQKEIDISNQEQLIANHKIKLEEKQKEMIEAMKAKTMLEKLKEKQLKAFLKALDDTEKKELDEIGLVRYAR